MPWSLRVMLWQEDKQSDVADPHQIHGNVARENLRGWHREATVVLFGNECEKHNPVVV